MMDLLSISKYVKVQLASDMTIFNPFPHTAKLQQTTLKTAKSKYGISL